MAKKTIETNLVYDDITKKYRITLYDGVDANHKPKRKYKTLTNKKEALRLLKENNEKRILDQKNGTNNISDNVEKMTLEQAIEIFINRTVVETTKNSYQNLFKHIKANKISKILITKLKKSDIDNYTTFKINENKLKKQTINKHLILIKSSLNYVEQDNEGLSLPIIKKIQPLKIDDKFEPKFYSLEEIQELIKAVEKSDVFKIQIPILLGVELGMRREEVCGLRWKDINFEEKSVSIENVYTQYSDKYINKVPKTESSKRVNFLSDYILKYLKDYKEQQLKDMDILGPEYQTNELNYMLVDRFGKQVRPNYVSEMFKKFLEKNNLRPIRFHDLRHTFVSLGFNNGIPSLAISHAIGHSSPEITQRIYTHLSEKNDIQTTRNISNIIHNIEKEEK